MTGITAFIVDGTCNTITVGDSMARLKSVFGEPEHLEPARKSYPTFAIYGPLEFRLEKDRINYIGLDLNSERQPPASAHVLFEQKLDFQIADIAQLLRANSVEWLTDSIMSDDAQTVWITTNGVHLAFDAEGRLGKIGAVGNLDQ